MDSLPPHVQKFRADYRARAYGPYYHGWAHFAFTSAGSLAVIVFSLSQLSGVTPRSLLTIPATFLLANLMEYMGHRGPMHGPRAGLRRLYQRHTLEHHRFFTHESMTYESSRDFKMVLFPPVMLLFFLGALATPLGALFFLLFSRSTGWLFVTTAMAYFLSYEWLHFCYHLPEEHWASRLPFMPALRRHHTAHHDLSLMGKWNFNITFPICDWLFGTAYRGRGRRA
jgi:hypothetical protein